MTRFPGWNKAEHGRFWVHAGSYRYDLVLVARRVWLLDVKRRSSAGGYRLCASTQVSTKGLGQRVAKAYHLLGDGYRPELYGGRERLAQAAYSQLTRR
jgi:hypothetical protein